MVLPMTEPPAALWSQVRQALAGKEISVQASILDSTPRFFGDVYRVSVIISCAGYLFELIDEVGKSVHDFDLFQPTPLPCNGIIVDDEDPQRPQLDKGEMSSACLMELSIKIVASHRDLIRGAIGKLFPKMRVTN